MNPPEQSLLAKTESCKQEGEMDRTERARELGTTDVLRSCVCTHHSANRQPGAKTVTHKICYPRLDLSKRGLGIVRTNLQSQWNLVYGRFHRTGP